MMHVAKGPPTAHVHPHGPCSWDGREADECHTTNLPGKRLGKRLDKRLGKGLGRRRQGAPPILAILTFAVLALLLSYPVRAVEPGEMLKDPSLEARARHISQELRCLVCQNQSIDDSSAELAGDLRILVRERLAAGDSDAAVLAFVEARYGEFVLLRPRLAPHTLLLWLTPLLLLGGAAFALLRHTRGRHWRGVGEEPQGGPLSPAERQRLDELLQREER